MMKVTRVNAPQGVVNGIANGNAPRRPDIPAQADVNWFSSAIEPAAPATPTADNKAWLGALAEKSDKLENLLQKAERQVGKSITGNNPKDVMDATRTLSSFYLESLLNAKVVAKSVQSLEKLTNLQ
ncbi:MULTISPECIES: EscI/YscI/HrpB family type III secretion system inner rod protein [Dickeya]|uniref:Type III secretion apparatus protein, YscI/HrpB family n=1 Tax=Dickeya zeae (strain Ech586) TaxID=590409 RepID=D2BZ59_DICZ5|nr:MULTISPECIES: EscI/YscI/HrpB family type III secretion system inner rod protein [Dickeya]ACZ76754.1 type III secretion apparatus protein, YscI/HrpB family [Dickeya parazeae Ech586]MBP2836250.1 EscI/YscI/HrpB family type III secretion system inner rod protein [Dickeya parazeae]UCZ75057.1 EscI/YscI/HrpB family type III secretion system inner rod protein [Dickeya zeae]